jgi:hypothetical protein
MSDKSDRLFEEHEAFQKMMRSSDDLQRHIDRIGNAQQSLGIGSAMKDLIQREEAHRKILADLPVLRNVAKISQEVARWNKPIDDPFGKAVRLGLLNSQSGFLESMSANSALQKTLTGLPDFGAMAKIGQDFTGYAKLIDGPFENDRRLGLLDSQSDLMKSINRTFDAQQAYENLFRLPALAELDRFAHAAMGHASLVRTVLGSEDRVKTAMAAMHAPWFQIDKGLVSATALSELIAIGRGIDSLPAFDHDFAVALRPGLGDWRDTHTPTTESLVDPYARSDFYVDQGFDRDLTDFTTLAFDEGLQIAGLREPVTTESGDDQQDSNERATAAFDQLRRFEIALRRFIEQVMRSAYGDDWMKGQLPQKMLDAWTEKKTKAIRVGEADQPLIDYADFTDYKGIIERTDNWDKVFKTFFRRSEDVRESFQRLFPVRIATMHGRIITRDDELLLYVETKRVLRAIGAS